MNIIKNKLIYIEEVDTSKLIITLIIGLVYSVFYFYLPGRSIFFFFIERLYAIIIFVCTWR